MKNKRQALGRGLGALLPPPRSASADTDSSPSREGLRTVAIEHLEPNRDQPRTHFDRTALEELAASLRTQGLIQPIVASPIAERPGQYLILAGERRWRAAQLAGIHDVPVIVRDTPQHARLELALVENLQRADLNPLEEARAYQQLVDLNGFTHDQLAERVGKDRTTITNAIRLLRLPPAVQDMVVEGKLSMGHARALLSLQSSTDMIAMAHRVVERELSVRATEKLVRDELAADRPPASEPEDEDTERHRIIVRDLEDRLCRRLGVRVALKTGKNPRGPGRIEIPYRGLDELNRVLHLLLEDA